MFTYIVAAWALMLLASILCAIRSSVNARRAQARAAEEAQRKAQEAAQRRREAEEKEAAKKKEQAAQRARRETARKEAAEEKHRETMRRKEELHAQRLRHIAEVQAARPQPQRKPQEPAQADAEQAQPAPAAMPAQPQPVALSVAEFIRQNAQPQRPKTIQGPFAGQTVSFTGKLSGMTRREAIEAVQERGGKAFASMPAATTLLVVGKNPGMTKMDKADEWIGSVRKITEAQFLKMLETTAA